MTKLQVVAIINVIFIIPEKFTLKERNTMKKILAATLAFVTVFSTVSFATPSMADTVISADETFADVTPAEPAVAETMADNDVDWTSDYGDLLFYIDFENTAATVKDNTEISMSQIGGINPDWSSYNFKFINSSSNSGTVVTDSESGNRYFTFKNNANSGYPQVNLNFTGKLPTNGRYTLVADVWYKLGNSGGTLYSFDFKPRIYNNAFKSGENEAPWLQLGLGTLKVGDSFPEETWKTAVASYYYPTFETGGVVYDADYYGTILVPFTYQTVNGVQLKPTTKGEDVFAIDNIKLWFEEFEEKSDPVYGDMIFDMDFDSAYDETVLYKRGANDILESTNFIQKLQNAGYVNPKYVKNKDLYFSLSGVIQSSAELVDDGNGNMVLKFKPTTSMYPQLYITANRQYWGKTTTTFSSTVANDGTITDNPGIYTMKFDYKLDKGEDSVGFNNLNFGSRDIAIGDYSITNTWGWGNNSKGFTTTGEWVKDAVSVSAVWDTFKVSTTEYHSAGKSTAILCAIYNSTYTNANDTLYFDNVRLYYRPLIDTVTISMGDNTLANDVSFTVDYSANGINTTMTKSELINKITDWGDKILVDIVKKDGTTLGDTINVFENTEFKAVWKSYNKTALSVDFKVADDKIEINSAGSAKTGYKKLNEITYNNDGIGFATVKFNVTDADGKSVEDGGLYDTGIKLAKANGNGTTKILDTGAVMIRMRVRNAKSETAEFYRGNTASTYNPYGTFTMFVNVDDKNGDFLNGWSGAHAKRSKDSSTVNYNDMGEQWFTIYIDLTKLKGYEHLSPGDITKENNDTWGTDANGCYWWNDATILKLFRLDFPDFGVWDGMEFDFDFIHFIEREDVNPHAYHVSSVRTDSYTGIRFMSSVTATQKAKVNEYGYIIARKTVLDGTELTHDCGKKFVTGIAYDENTNLVYDVDSYNNTFFTAVVYNVPEEMYTDVLVARPYTKTSDGKYYYGEAVERSTYEVAKAVKENTDAYNSLRDDAKAKIDAIVNYVDNQTTTDNEEA